MNNHIQGLYSLPIPDHARGFFDPIKTREWLHTTALNAFQKKLNALESPAFKLKVTNFSITAPTPSYKEQNKALMEKKDIVAPLKGTFQLIDKKTGNVVDEKTTTVAHIPWLTERNTVILGGSEYLAVNQLRLKPGVYTRIKDSGEAEAHINVMPGTGFGGKVIFYPERALFVYQVGTTQIKLYGLLHELGVSDTEMEKAWGHEIFVKNKAESAGNELDKFYNKIFGKYEETEGTHQ